MAQLRNQDGGEVSPAERRRDAARMIEAGSYDRAIALALSSIADDLAAITRELRRRR